MKQSFALPVFGKVAEKLLSEAVCYSWRDPRCAKTDIGLREDGAVIATAWFSDEDIDILKFMAEIVNVYLKAIKRGVIKKYSKTTVECVLSALLMKPLDKFPKYTIEKYVGKRRTPLEIEARKVLWDEHTRLSNEYKQKITELDAKFDEETASIKKKYDDIKQDEYLKFVAKMKEIEEKIAKFDRKARK